MGPRFTGVWQRFATNWAIVFINSSQRCHWPVRLLSRHAKSETLLKYDDSRVDEARAIARLLGEDSA
jgi:hypothetical protein